MRKSFKYIFCLIFLLIATGSLWAKDKYTVTVLPFTLHSAENIEYVKQGIGDMLSTRISVPNKIVVTDKDAVLEELKKANVKEMSLNDAYKIGKKLSSDYVVWGSITKIGSSISIDGKLVDIESNKSDVGFFTQSQNLDEIIPKVNDFSQRIVQHILGTLPPVITAAPVNPPATAASTPTAPGSSKESQIIAGMKSGKKGTLTSVINPEYINSPDPFNKRGFWMSQQFPTEFKGMAIGDVNGDGLNEVVTIDAHNVYIYQKVGEGLKLLEKIAGKPYDTYLAVDVADINKSGVMQIFVTSINTTNLDSFVLEYKDKKYTKIASDLSWFLRVLDTPSGIPLLLCQDLGTLMKPFDTQIYEMIWRDGKYIADQKMKIPIGLAIYGLAIDNLGTGGGEKVIAFDDLDYLCIFDKTNKQLTSMMTFGGKNKELVWRSDEVYGGSNNFVANWNSGTPEDHRSDQGFYLNQRILTYSKNNGEKKEIIIIKNLSSSGRVLSRLKLFTSCEIYDLEWDGLGMAENWRTKKINGYVADYAIKDIDNDGKPEIVLALVLSVGASVKDRSVIVVYKLDTAQ
jgi:TolB-like protein